MHRKHQPHRWRAIGGPLADDEAVATGRLRPVDLAGAVARAIVAASQNVAAAAEHSFARFMPMPPRCHQRSRKANGRRRWPHDHRSVEGNPATSGDKTKGPVGGHAGRAARKSAASLRHEGDQQQPAVAAAGGDASGGPFDAALINPARGVALKGDLGLDRFPHTTPLPVEAAAAPQANHGQPGGGGADQDRRQQPAGHRQGPRRGGDDDHQAAHSCCRKQHQRLPDEGIDGCDRPRRRQQRATRRRFQKTG